MDSDHTQYTYTSAQILLLESNILQLINSVALYCDCLSHLSSNIVFYISSELLFYVFLCDTHLSVSHKYCDFYPGLLALELFSYQTMLLLFKMLIDLISDTLTSNLEPCTSLQDCNDRDHCSHCG